MMIGTNIPQPDKLDVDWDQLQEIQSSVIQDHLQPYLQQSLPRYLMFSALDQIITPVLTEPQIFDHFVLPWVLFNWVPLENFGVPGFFPEKTLAQNYLITHPDQLTKIEQTYINSMESGYYSLFQVHKVNAGHSVLVEDLLLGTRHTAREPIVSQQLSADAIIFGRLLTLANESALVGLAPFSFSTQMRSPIQSLKSTLIQEYEGQRLDESSLQIFDEMLMQGVIGLWEDTVSNQPGQVTVLNTSGPKVGRTDSKNPDKTQPRDENNPHAS